MFALPDPTIVTLRGTDYLVLTETGARQALSVCFYAIPAFSASLNEENELDSSQDDIILQTQRDPVFKLPGAEMFLGLDSEENVYFLTNKSLWEL